MKRIAFYGGSFDPVHRGHLAIAHALLDQFSLDEFVFVPAFHAPHKLRKTSTSAYDRYAMLCLVTQNEPNIRVSKMEIEMPERPYSVETLTRLNAELPNDEIYFVMGADSWMDITTWREWEKVLALSNHIVATRPGVEIALSHVTDEIRSRIVDLRSEPGAIATGSLPSKRSIYITDAVNIDISATEIRQNIRDIVTTWREDVPLEVANYIEKYQIYN
ncbi:MAG: nicotinate (nicotinamide) nucleotide adenylyltransferase [Chloracidobacterium sp.]|nr:nicotinate (nicotinamide) nucleotide adenylyltransferase [Chloracidobacterium sp.]